MRKKEKILLLFICLSIAAIVFGRGFIKEAVANNGAFQYTKHGGGTVDGLPFPGVNRGVNPDFSAYYSDSASGSGQYLPGECLHCHEAHNSFGGASPPPEGTPYDSSAGTPDRYLLFGNNDSDICWYCHENMTLGMPPKTIGYGYWGFYKGKTNYQAASHGQSSNFQWPGDDSLMENGVVNPSLTWARDRGAGSLPPTVNTCINCHTPHGMMGAAFDTGTAPATTNYTVATTADTTLMDRQTLAREEALCLNCHDGSPATTGSIKSEVDKYLLTTASGHPVRANAYYGRHDLAKEDPATITAGWFTSSTAHSECTDCHNPHMAQGVGTGGSDGTVFQASQQAAGATRAWDAHRYDTPTNSSSSAVKLPPSNIGTWGVSVNTSTGAITGVISDLTTSDRLYNLCFKCHSAWAWDSTATNWNSGITSPTTARTGWTGTLAMPANYPMTDIAKEFATSNPAYHPVFAAGKNTPERSGIRNPNWCTGASSVYSSTDNCISVIGARGDLSGNSITQTVTYYDGSTATVQLEQTLSETFVPPWLHTSIITCVDCHEDSVETNPRGPHGSDRPFILRSVDTTITYDVCSAVGANATTKCATTPYAYSGIIVGERTIFCLNCHRADVYNEGIAVGTLPTYRVFSRQPHPAGLATNDEGIFNGNYGDTRGAPRIGIACMGCHGGGGSVSGNPINGASCNTTVCKLGNIHGHSAITDQRTSPAAISSRLIIPGANWSAWTSSGTADGECTSPSDPGVTLNNAWTAGCTNNTRGAFDAGAATYIY